MLSTRPLVVTAVVAAVVAVPVLSLLAEVVVVLAVAIRWVRIAVFGVVTSHVVVRYAGVGHGGGQWGGWNEGLGKMSHDKCCGSLFRTYIVGLPLPGSPLVFLLPPIVRQTTIIPLKRGGAAAVRPRF